MVVLMEFLGNDDVDEEDFVSLVSDAIDSLGKLNLFLQSLLVILSRGRGTLLGVFFNGVHGVVLRSC
jgi:hypothetical protein